MVKSIKCIDFQDLVSCKTVYCYGTENYCYNTESFYKLNYEFVAGNVYGLVSDFGMGSWGVATCIGGRGSKNHKTGKILLNGVEVSYNELVNHSCFVSEYLFSGVNKPKKMLTPRLCIQKALEISGEPYSVDQIKEMFDLTGSEGRFDRDLRYVGTEIWSISIAVSFALGKDVFCYPWLNQHDIYKVNKKDIDALRQHNKIVLIPTSQVDMAEKISDYLILFTKQGLVFK